jgi:hypothetical protein
LEAFVKEIQLWRDKIQTRACQPIIWVVLVEGSNVRQTLNAQDPHSDPLEALLFARAEGQRLGVNVRHTIREV